MKKVILFLLVCGFLSTTSFAQNKKYLEKRAETFTEAAAKKMEFTDAQKTLVCESLLEKFHYQENNINGKNLSPEEKKEVYKNAFKTFSDKLLTSFNWKQIKSMNDVFAEEQEKLKNKNK